MKMISALLLIFAFTMLALGVYRVIDAAHGEPIQLCVNVADREHIRGLTLEAIDAAYKDQVGHLFTVWMKDPSPEPTRAMVGMSNAIDARARARYNAENWQPRLPCKE